jgi:hypothetical protein
VVFLLFLVGVYVSRIDWHNLHFARNPWGLWRIA